DRVRAHCVGQRGALIDAGAGRVVVVPRQLGADTQLVERTIDEPDDVPSERVLRIAVVGGGAGRVALFGAAPTVGDLSGYRGVVHGVVAWVEEDGHAGDSRGRGWGAERRHTQHCRRDTGEFQEVTS